MNVGFEPLDTGHLKVYHRQVKQSWALLYLINEFEFELWRANIDSKYWKMMTVALIVEGLE
jgi:hypothetical protein